MPLFPTQTEEGLFYAVYFVWIATLLVERVVVAGSGQGEVKTRADRGSVVLIYLSVFASISVAYAFAYSRTLLLPDWVYGAGVVMMLAGIATREWAVFTLRGYFSYRVRIRVDHRVVDSGPYRWVRHPAYTGSMLTILGLGAALRTGAGIVVLAALFSLAYWYRIRVEERALLAELGDAYADYMKRTRRLIPFVL